MKHEHHTTEHQKACVFAARSLLEAAGKVLEASQYEWTAVIRPTLAEAETEISRALSQISQAKGKAEKKEADIAAAPGDGATAPAGVSSGVQEWPIPRG